MSSSILPLVSLTLFVLLTGLVILGIIDDLMVLFLAIALYMLGNEQRELKT